MLHLATAKFLDPPSAVVQDYAGPVLSEGSATCTTTFPMLAPLLRYRIASGSSSKANVLPTTGGRRHKPPRETISSYSAFSISILGGKNANEEMYERLLPIREPACVHASAAPGLDDDIQIDCCCATEQQEPLESDSLSIYGRNR